MGGSLAYGEILLMEMASRAASLPVRRSLSYQKGIFELHAGWYRTDVVVAA
ncbi:MAG: hypothetical protein ACT4OO_07800 [Nitrospiraceae bacterium]